MKDKQEFFQLLTAMDGKDFAEYRAIIGDFDFSRYIVKINRVPEDSELRTILFVVRVPQSIASFPPHLFNTPIRRTALEDLLTRKVAATCEQIATFDDEGIARRRIGISAPGQKILPRSSMVVSEDYIEARLNIELPSRRGRVLGASAQQIFFEDLPRLVDASLIYCNLDENEVERFADNMEDADQIRQALPTRGLVSFIGQGCRVERAIRSDRPAADAAAFDIADELQIELEVPNRGAVRGLGIPAGVTVILGDDYSGRIALARAIAAGIYNHIPGDGRELVITMPDAVYIAAEPGRSVQRVDVSPFVGVAGTSKTYTSDCADSAASQAASTVEMLEIGARALIFDESDSAAGFLGRDTRFADIFKDTGGLGRSLASRARQLADELGVSIIVAGSSSAADFVPVADLVLRVASNRITDATREARQLQISPPISEGTAADLTKTVEKARWVVPGSIDASHGRHDAVLAALAIDRLQFGRSTIELPGSAQLADIHQTSTIALVLHYGKQRYLDEGRPIREILDLVDRDLSSEGLECLSREQRGDLARPRRYEIAAALNRLRTLRISHAGE
jgi:predicted ABC-class ATPase